MTHDENTGKYYKDSFEIIDVRQSLQTGTGIPGLNTDD